MIGREGGKRKFAAGAMHGMTAGEPDIQNLWTPKLPIYTKCDSSIKNLRSLLCGSELSDEIVPRRQKTVENECSMSKSCFLQHVSPCKGGISREHYISRTVLEQIGGGSVRIGGLDWQPEKELQSVGVDALTAKILCEEHNSSLSDLDAEAGRFFQTIHQIDKQPLDAPDHTVFDGHMVERWILKIAAGLARSPKKRGHSISEQKLEILVTNNWPVSWGMYVPISSAPKIFAKGVEIELRSHPATGELLAVWIYIAGVILFLILGVPDKPESFGFYRPRGLIFKDLPGEKRIEFVWTHPSEQAVTSAKIGSAKTEPQHWSTWKS